MSDPASPVAPAPPRARQAYIALAFDIAMAIAIVLGVSLLCGMGWGLWRGFALAREGAPMHEAMRQLGVPGTVFQVVSTILAMAIAASTLLWWRRRPSREEWRHSLEAARRPGTWAWSIGTAVVTTLAVAVITQLAATVGIHPDPSNDAVVRELMRRSPWLLWPFAVLLAPMYEEVLFRRVFFGRLLEAGRPWAALLVGSSLFALAHELPGVGANGAPATLVLWFAYATMGAGFAFAYRRCGTLWAAVLSHMLHNLFACAMLWWSIT